VQTPCSVKECVAFLVCTEIVQTPYFVIQLDFLGDCDKCVILIEVLFHCKEHYCPDSLLISGMAVYKFILLTFTAQCKRNVVSNADLAWNILYFFYIAPFKHQSSKKNLLLEFFPSTSTFNTLKIFL